MFYLDECSSYLWNKHLPALLDGLFHKCPLNSWLMVSFSFFISLLISYLLVLFTTNRRALKSTTIIVDLLIFSVLSFPFSWQILIHIFWGLLLGAFRIVKSSWWIDIFIILKSTSLSFIIFFFYKSFTGISIATLD